MADFVSASIKFRNDTITKTLEEIFSPITKQYLIENASYQRTIDCNNKNYDYRYSLYSKDDNEKKNINGKELSTSRNDIKWEPTCEDIRQFAYRLKSKNGWDCSLISRCGDPSKGDFVDYRW
jgi:hypothetical protein